jgi:hypothetical protein
MRRVIRIMLWIALILVTGLAVMVRLRYGGGQSYRDVTGAPILSGDELETVLSYPEPIGNVAVSSDGRGFFTVHPESRPEGAKLLEFRDGAAWPYPSEEFQDEIFQTPLGVVVDRQHRLWIIDHGKHGFGTPRLLAIDLLTDEVVHDHRFDNTAAPGGSFLQDLQVSPDGCTVFIADVSFWRKRPAIVVHDIATSADRRVLEGHPSVAAQDWIITTSSKRMVFFGGLAAMKPGIRRFWTHRSVTGPSLRGSRPLATSLCLTGSRPISRAASGSPMSNTAPCCGWARMESSRPGSRPRASAGRTPSPSDRTAGSTWPTPAPGLKACPATSP